VDKKGEEDSVSEVVFYEAVSAVCEVASDDFKIGG
jgi:hypothetical protein